MKDSRAQRRACQPPGSEEHGAILAERKAFAWHMVRNLAADPSFAEQIGNIDALGKEEAVTGPYHPKTKYMTKAAFEALGCPKQPTTPAMTGDEPATSNSWT